MTSELFDLSGKKALLTGSSRGIGLALAHGLARHGADVALVARNQDQLLQAQREIQNATARTAWIFPYDVANIDGAAAFFETVVQQTGPIDILVNCAGTASRGPSEDFSLKIWHEVIQVNLYAAFAFAQAFCRHRKQNGGYGKIINIGSLMCQSARPFNPPYAASKGGLLLLTKELAVEWAKYNINVNVIGPGWFPTQMTAPMRQKEEFNQWVISRTPMGRWGKVEDLVGAAVFLASAASDFVTGQIIYVDGGWLAAI